MGNQWKAQALEGRSIKTLLGPLGLYPGNSIGNLVIWDLPVLDPIILLLLTLWCAWLPQLLTSGLASTTDLSAPAV